MAAPRGDQIVDGYLARVESVLSDLPGAQRARIVGEVRDRIARARASTVDETDADVLRLLDEIGEPGAIAAQARAGLPAAPRTGWLEVLAITGLSLVWPLGVVLLWRSRVWSTRQKLIGALVPPGGYAVPLLGALLIHPVIVNCTSTYDENGKLVSSSCPQPDTAVAVADVALTIVLYSAIVLWLVLPIVSAVFLTRRAWRSGGRPRLALVPAVAVGPVVALTLLSVVLVAEFAGPVSRAVAQGPPPLPSPPPPSQSVTGDMLAFPNLTPAQLESAFGALGFSCDGPRQLGGQWVTTCRQRTGAVAGFGSSDHTIVVVSATLTDPTAAPEFFDSVVQSVCSPADVGEIDAWTHAHLQGDSQTDIDGYNVNVIRFGDTVTLTIVRSRSLRSSAAP